MFQNVSSKPMEIGDGLLDFGWQWTVANKNGKQVDGYFIKITAPLEFVVHHNAHFNSKELPATDALKELFRKSFEETNSVADQLKL
jgi:hypothetical protein